MRTWIERHRNILDFTLSSLLRRKRKNTALVSVYTLIVFLLASVLFFTYALHEEASLLLKEAPEMIVQKLVAGRHELIPVAYADRLKAIRGVNSIKARLWGYYYDPIVGANYTLMAVEEPEVSPGSVAVGEGVSRIRLASPGDTLEFRTYQGVTIELEIKGVFSSESGLATSDLVLISEHDFREIFGTPKDFATDLAVSVRNSKELSTIAVKVAEILPDTRQILREEILRTYDAIFNWRGGILLAILFGAVLAFIIFAWDKASGLSVEEKKEIGILKAIGWETSDIIRMKFWEGLVVSLSSFLIGIVLAYIHVFFTSFMLFEPVLKGWAVLYPAFKITPFINGAQVASLFFLTVVPYTVATIIPSWRAAIVDPDSVMR
ncbi:MAG: FtsX-like permease family protein [Desulfobacterota bacterium]|jgi:cell division protein FtsX|nr:FtsX-like permease family protein [Thermodesulfobacteriota bacterium]